MQINGFPCGFHFELLHFCYLLDLVHRKKMHFTTVVPLFLIFIFARSKYSILLSSEVGQAKNACDSHNKSSALFLVWAKKDFNSSVSRYTSSFVPCVHESGIYYIHLFKSDNSYLCQQSLCVFIPKCARAHVHVLISLKQVPSGIDAADLRIPESLLYKLTDFIPKYDNLCRALANSACTV